MVSALFTNSLVEAVLHFIREFDKLGRGDLARLFDDINRVIAGFSIEENVDRNMVAVLTQIPSDLHFAESEVDSRGASFTLNEWSHLDATKLERWLSCITRVSVSSEINEGCIFDDVRDDACCTCLDIAIHAQ